MKLFILLFIFFGGISSTFAAICPCDAPLSCGASRPPSCQTHELSSMLGKSFCRDNKPLSGIQVSRYAKIAFFGDRDNNLSSTIHHRIASSQIDSNEFYIDTYNLLTGRILYRGSQVYSYDKAQEAIFVSTGAIFYRKNCHL